MLISNLKHFLDDNGNIPKEIRKEARDRVSFLAIIVDKTTKSCPSTLTQTDIRCFKKKCDGMIKTALVSVNEEIHWYCLKCDNEGIISHWQKTKWDNRGRSKS